MPPSPHDDLHSAARDHTQKEGRKESHCDLRVKHCHCPLKHWSCDLAHLKGSGMFSTSISQMSSRLPCGLDPEPVCSWARAALDEEENGWVQPDEW